MPDAVPCLSCMAETMASPGKRARNADGYGFPTNAARSSGDNIMGRGQGSGRSNKGGGGGGGSTSGGETAATSQTVAASKNGLTPEQEQNLKNYVYKTASDYLGYPIKPDGIGGVDRQRLDAIISDGWNGIPNGEIVYVSKLHKGEPRPGENWYRKVDNNTVVDQSGRLRQMDDRQKNNMLGSYALQKTTTKRAYG